MDSEFLSELTPRSEGIVESMNKLGFSGPNFALVKTNRMTTNGFHANCNNIYSLVRITYSTGHAEYNRILHIEPKINLFWFNELTKATMFAIMDTIPSWAANDLDRQFIIHGSMTGKDNKNSLKIPDFEKVITAIYKQINNDLREYGGTGIPEYLMADAIAVNQQFPIRNKFHEEKKALRYINFLRFLESGVDFEAATSFDKANIDYDQMVSSEFYNPDLPPEILLALVGR